MEFQPLVHTYFVLSWRDFTYFNVHVSNHTTERVNITSILASVPPTQNAGNCTVRVMEGPNNLGSKGGIIEAGVRDQPNLSLIPQNCYALTLYHVCKKGSASTPIAVNITTDKYPNIDLLFVKFSGGRRVGFDVGKLSLSSSSQLIGRIPYGIDVVLSGIAMPLWNENIFSNGGFHVTAGKQDNDTFYIWMDDPQMVQEFQVDVVSKVPVTLSGPAAEVSCYTGPCLTITGRNCKKRRIVGTDRKLPLQWADIGSTSIVSILHLLFSHKPGSFSSHRTTM